jgi:hypothetical protein
MAERVGLALANGLLTLKREIVIEINYMAGKNDALATTL